MQWPHASLTVGQLELIDHAMYILRDQFQNDDNAAYNECQIVINELAILMSGLEHALKKSNASIINVDLSVSLLRDGR